MSISYISCEGQGDAGLQKLHQVLASRDFMGELYLLDVYGGILVAKYISAGENDHTVLVSKHFVSRAEIDPCSD